MTKVIQFKNNQEEHSCPTCDLIWEHFENIAESDSHEELFENLSELVFFAKRLGVKEFLTFEIGQKADLLEQLDCECGGCCEECNCEDED